MKIVSVKIQQSCLKTQKWSKLQGFWGHRVHVPSNMLKGRGFAGFAVLPVETQGCVVHRKKTELSKQLRKGVCIATRIEAT